MQTLEFRQFLHSDGNKCYLKLNVKWNENFPSDKFKASSLIQLHLQAFSIIYVHIDYDEKKISFGTEYELKPPDNSHSWIYIVAGFGSFALVGLLGLYCRNQKKKEIKLRRQLKEYSRMS